MEVLPGGRHRVDTTPKLVRRTRSHINSHLTRDTVVGGMSKPEEMER